MLRQPAVTVYMFAVIAEELQKEAARSSNDSQRQRH